jgi:cutinase
VEVHRLRAVPLCLALAALLAAAAPLPATASTAPCAGVVVVAARGSGQPPGAGIELQLLARALDDRVGGVAVLPVRYPASPLGGALWDPDAFARGVRQGARQLVASTLREARRCPGSDLVWAGFSQGALAVRTAMAQVDRPLADAVVLLADPQRRPGDVVDRGPAAADAGGDEGLPVPRPWADRTTSWCAAGDPVCDPAAGNVLGGLLLHAQRYRSPALVGAAADAVAASL